jgi:hypothetical protein
MLDFTRPKKLLEAQGQGHEPRDARQAPCRNFRSSFDRACACLAALMHAAAEWDVAYNRLR